MTLEQRIERARRAKLAMEEFFAPAFDAVEQEYGERMISVAGSVDPRAPEVIARLANGIKAARSVRSQIEGYIAEGQVAEREKEATDKLAAMSPAKSRLLKIGQH